jgi:hypothetical protein
MSIPVANGLYSIVNSTRYNTDDLVALFQDLVKAYEERGFSVKHAHDGTPQGMVIDIGDYNPSSVWEQERQWDSTLNQYSTKKSRIYVKRGGYSLTVRFKVGLIPPEKLYDNPLEALVSADEDERAPAEMSERIVCRFQEMLGFTKEGQTSYDWQVRNEILEVVVRRNAAGIRIAKKRGAVDLGEKRLREKRLKAQKALVSGVYDVRTAFYHLQTACQVVKHAERLCVDAEVEQMFSTEKFAECAAYLDAVMRGMEETVATKMVT